MIRGLAMADDPEQKVRWVRKDAFVMPVLPKTLKVDPVLAAILHLSAFLELSRGETIRDPEGAAEAGQLARSYFERFTGELAEAVKLQIMRVAEHARKKKWGVDVVDYFTGIAGSISDGGETK